jgi:putative transposase
MPASVAWHAQQHAGMATDIKRLAYSLEPAHIHPTTDTQAPSKCVRGNFQRHSRDGCLNENCFINLQHAKAVIETWRRGYNEKRAKKATGGMTPLMCAKKLKERQVTLNSLSQGAFVSACPIRVVRAEAR